LLREASNAPQILTRVASESPPPEEAARGWDTTLRAVGLGGGSGSHSNQSHPVGLPGANVDEGGYGDGNNFEAQSVFGVVNLDYGHPDVGGGAARGDESVAVSVMSVRASL
jgi:hypothetical protein